MHKILKSLLGQYYVMKSGEHRIAEQPDPEMIVSSPLNFYTNSRRLHANYESFGLHHYHKEITLDELKRLKKPLFAEKPIFSNF